MIQSVEGFSQLSKPLKIKWLAKEYFRQTETGPTYKTLTSFWHPNSEVQKLFDELSENTLSNFYLPFGVAPNFLINGKCYCVPMVIEESSVVAAASKAAKFWLERGGFSAIVKSTVKVGQVHFYYSGDSKLLSAFFNEIQPYLIESVNSELSNMKLRGGGLLSLELLDKTAEAHNFYQLFARFDTCDAMGANLINTCLETFAFNFETKVRHESNLLNNGEEFQVVMAILSNYTPECLVEASVECDVNKLYYQGLQMSPEEFAKKLERAGTIANYDVYRATTNNKGIFNGIDSVVLATGNDFRASAACGHAYAARSGKYRSLTTITVKDKKFKMTLEIPLALGTVGGLTNLHPLSKLALELLGNPNSKDLMMIVASVGLAQNFAAVKSLVTTGIQLGHMKMHLLNILNQIGATEEEKSSAKLFFQHEKVSFTAVRNFIESMRWKQ